MEAGFWHQKWERGDIGFHQSAVNPFLASHIQQLALPAEGRVFLPLCGKTLDMAWLLANGYRVAGAELSEMAIRELFQTLNVAPTISEEGRLIRYSGPGIDVFVGDFFALSGEQLGAVDAIYDRAALVALPHEMRKQYAAHLMKISHVAPQLLISYEYDQSRIDGPPFSVTGGEIQQHYSGVYHIHELARQDVAGGMKGRTPASEACWLLNAVHSQEKR